MNQVELLIGIVERDLTPEYEKRMEQAAVHVLVSTPARGTAKVEMLHYLGQERTEKTALFGVVTPATGRTLVRQFQHDRCFRRGSCVWAAVPISSVGGATALEFMSEKQEKSEVGAVAVSYTHLGGIPGGVGRRSGSEWQHAGAALK